MLHPVFEAQLPLITQLFKDKKVKRAYAFGSLVTEQFNDDSDIDLLITFEEGLEPLEKGEKWWELYYAIKDIFNREVDLLTESSLKNPYFIEELNEKRELIYAA